MSRIATTLAPLSHRDFRRLWTGTFFGTAAQWIQQATLGWVVYDVTHSPSLLGAVLGVRAKLLGLGADPVGSTPEEFTAFRKAEYARVAKLVAKAGIKAEY